MPSMRNWSEARLLLRSRKAPAAHHCDTILHPGNVCYVDLSIAACYKLGDLCLLISIDSRRSESNAKLRLANSIEQSQQPI